MQLQVGSRLQLGSDRRAGMHLLQDAASIRERTCIRCSERDGEEGAPAAAHNFISFMSKTADFSYLLLFESLSAF